MKIARLTVWRLKLPLTHACGFSGGSQHVERLHSTVLRIETDDGLEGWSETCPWGPGHLPSRHGPGVRAALETLGPAILGRAPRAPGAVGRAMARAAPGHQGARSAVDIAWWDILGKAAGQPLWRLRVAEAPAPVALNSSIPTADPEAMRASVAAHAGAGNRTHSAKIDGADPDADVARIKAVIAALPEGHAVTFGVNCAWTPGVAVEVLYRAPARGWVEQPCPTLDQCAHVAARVPQPIMLDERLLSFDDHLAAWRRDACEGVKVKPARPGGLTAARAARDLGVALGWRMHVEDTGGSAIADTVAFHLAASTPDANRLASWLGRAHLADDPMAGLGPVNDGGVVRLGDAPGLGLAPDHGAFGAPVAVNEA